MVITQHSKLYDEFHVVRAVTMTWGNVSNVIENYGKTVFKTKKQANMALEAMKKMSEQLKLVSAFLSQYVQPEEGMILPDDEESIRGAIELLLHENVMTVGEIKKEALEEYNVIVPYNLFPEMEN